MAGFREFVTGEVLTAANVDDFLMKQTVQKFADAAARDAALGTAVAGGNALREGMVSYLDDENEVQYFDGTAWDAISQPIAGIGSNVVSTNLLSTFTTSSTSFTPLTGLTATITPSTDTSLILVVLSLNITVQAASGGTLNFGHFRLTGGNADDYIGAADGSRERVAASVASQSENVHQVFPKTVVYLDAPATASAITYGVEVRSTTAGRPVLVNKGLTDSDSAFYPRGASSITVIEVAA